MAEAGVPFRLVDGIAVVHHGDARRTEDVDVVVAAAGPAALDALLASHGFTRESRTRLRHVATGVRVDRLVAAVTSSSSRRSRACCAPSSRRCGGTRSKLALG